MGRPHNNVLPMYRPEPKLPFNHPIMVASRRRKAGETRRHLVRTGAIRPEAVSPVELAEAAKPNGLRERMIAAGLIRS